MILLERLSIPRPFTIGDLANSLLDRVSIPQITLGVGERPVIRENWSSSPNDDVRFPAQAG
jgi:hypothetical protein